MLSCTELVQGKCLLVFIYAPMHGIFPREVFVSIYLCSHAQNLLSFVKGKCLLPPQGFGPEAKTRGGNIAVPACDYEEELEKKLKKKN